jgi:hypothetical protein
MKKLYVALIFSVALFTICTAFISTKYHNKSSSGITGQNGSPGEGTCSGCHAGGSTSTTVSINAVPAFTNNEYVQGQTYTITISVTGTGYPKFGFTSEILFTPNNTNAGTMANPGAGVILANGPSGRKNAIHNTPKTGAGTANFTYEWTAPTNGANTIRIYAVGNCVNGDGFSSGDFSRATSLVITTPAITDIEQQKLLALKGFLVYPNPAQDKINVNYNLSDTKNVCIQLCSITGEVAAELLNEQEESGMYSKKLSIPAGVASGMYFLKVNADSKVVAQRLVSVR